ncbi:MAG TPA: DUF222 domain-containing protein, partial [Jiangellaceae bacterium]|nr:DUF222 domain-containing protein [Jiangellaceae bacterium]
RICGQLDTENAAVLRSALDPLAAPNPAADGTQDPRTAGQRTADALVELARRANNEGTLPAGHGVRPHLSVIITLDSLLATTADTAVAPGELGWGGPPSAQAVRRIGCDAGISRVITDPAGVPLDVGRESRTVTPGQWTALIARDRGCAFAGCTRPAEWCIAHHIVHWADGGPTDLDNLVLLCAATTASSTTTAGTCEWPPTDTPNSHPHPGSTPTKSPDATPDPDTTNVISLVLNANCGCFFLAGEWLHESRMSRSARESYARPSRGSNRAPNRPQARSRSQPSRNRQDRVLRR